MTYLLALGLTLTTFSLTERAMAQGDSTSQADSEQAARDRMAREHFQSGRAYFASGDYERALDAFESAHELSQRSALHYNIYLCNERLGRWGDAAGALEQYLAHEAPVAERANLESRLTHLREREAATEEAAAVEAAALDESRVSDETEGRALRIAAISSFALAGTGAAMWIVAGAMGVKENGDLDSSCSPTCTEAEVDRLRALNTAANIGITFTAIGAAAGITLLLLARRNRDDSRAAISPWVSRSVAGLSARGSF